MSLPILTPSSGQNSAVAATRHNLTTSNLGNTSITSVRSGDETLQTTPTALTTAQAQQAITTSGLMNILRSLGHSTANLDESAQPVRQQNMRFPRATRTRPTRRARSLIETRRAQSGAQTRAPNSSKPKKTSQNNVQSTAPAPSSSNTRSQKKTQSTTATSSPSSSGAAATTPPSSRTSQNSVLNTLAAPAIPNRTTQSNAQTTAATPPRLSHETQSSSLSTLAASGLPHRTTQSNAQTTAAIPPLPSHTTQHTALDTAALPTAPSRTTQSNTGATLATPPRLSHETQNSARTDATASSSSTHTSENHVQSARSISFGGARARTGANHQTPTNTGIWARTTQARPSLNTADNTASLNTASKITNSPPESASSLTASSRCPELQPQDIICSVPVKLELEALIFLDNFYDLDYEAPDEGGSGSGSGDGSTDTLSSRATGTGSAIGQSAQEKPIPPSNDQCPIVLHRPDKKPTGADNALLSCAKMLAQVKEKPSCKKEAIEQCSGLLHRAAHKNKHHCQKIKSSLTRHRNNYHPELQEEFENLNCAHKPNLRPTAPPEPTMTPTEVTSTAPLPSTPSSWLPTHLSSASILGLFTGISIFAGILKLYNLLKKVVKACINLKNPI